LQDSDEFSGRTLGLQWEWNHNPDDTKWSLSERPGYLRLHAGPAEHLVTARNTLTQILQGPHAVFTTRIDLSHMVDGQRAGLVLFGVKPVWIGAVRDKGETRVTFASAGVETQGPAAGQTIVLRAEVTADQIVRFAWSGDGKHFEGLGEATPLSKFSWWKGSRPGLFSYTQGTDTGGYVDIDWFRARILKK
jgi:beta-xylosidase